MKISVIKKTIYNYKMETKKYVIKNLEIYTPVVDSIANVIEKQYAEDFDIENFLHFPILLNEDGSPWKYGVLYLLFKLKQYKKPSPLTLDSIADGLKHFKIFCDREDIDYLSAPRKVLRPTYLYREHLNYLVKKGQIVSSTLQSRMSAVVGFYEYLINEEGVKFKFPLWEKGITSISYVDQYGFKKIKEVNTKDVSRVNLNTSSDLYDDAIIDGGRLHPLSKEQQKCLLQSLKNISNTEMTLAFLISLTTGARIQTVCTLRKRHFSKNIDSNIREVKIKVGFGTFCDTKFNKNYILVMPSWIYNKIKIYLDSYRYRSREEKATHIFDTDDLQYIFLTNRGRPFYVAKDDPYRNIYRKIPNGGTIRTFITTTLKDEIIKNGGQPDFSFHDLRATFGLNVFDRLMQLVQNGEITLSYALIHLKDLMAHSSLLTTENYLKFRQRNKIKEELQDDFENYIFRLLYE